MLQRPSSTPSYPLPSTPSGSFVFFKSLLVAIAMSIARDDMGNIRELHTTAGLPHTHNTHTAGLPHNFRDASGGTDGTQVYVNSFGHQLNSCVTAGALFRQMAEEANTNHPWKSKSVLPPLSHARQKKRSWPQQGSVSNPYSNRMTNSNARQVEGRNDRAGASNALGSSPRHTPKRQKLGHPEQKTLSKYFFEGVSPPKRALAVPSTSKLVHPSLATADAIIIDEEDDTPAANDDPHDPIVVGTSSPDPIDMLDQKPSYVFDQKKPTPMDQFSASWEEERKSPQDGASTQRVRTTMMKQDVSRRLESASRMDSDGDDVQLGRPFFSGRTQSTTRAEVSSEQGSVKAKVALIEKSLPHVDLLTVRQSRKNGMKPKQVCLFDLVCGTRN